MSIYIETLGRELWKQEGSRRVAGTERGYF